MTFGIFEHSLGGDCTLNSCPRIVRNGQMHLALSAVQCSATISIYYT